MQWKDHFKDLENMRDSTRTPQHSSHQRLANSGSLHEKLRDLAGLGRNGDTQLAEIGPRAARMLDKLIHGGRKQINPRTGLREYMDPPGKHPGAASAPAMAPASAAAAAAAAMAAGAGPAAAGRSREEILAEMANIDKELRRYMPLTNEEEFETARARNAAEIAATEREIAATEREIAAEIARKEARTKRIIDFAARVKRIDDAAAAGAGGPGAGMGGGLGLGMPTDLSGDESDDESGRGRRGRGSAGPGAGRGGGPGAGRGSSSSSSSHAHGPHGHGGASAAGRRMAGDGGGSGSGGAAAGSAASRRPPHVRRTSAGATGGPGRGEPAGERVITAGRGHPLASDEPDDALYGGIKHKNIFGIKHPGTQKGGIGSCGFRVGRVLAHAHGLGEDYDPSDESESFRKDLENKEEDPGMKKMITEANSGGKGIGIQKMSEILRFPHRMIPESPLSLTAAKARNFSADEIIDAAKTARGDHHPIAFRTINTNRTGTKLNPGREGRERAPHALLVNGYKQYNDGRMFLHIYHGHASNKRSGSIGEWIAYTPGQPLELREGQGSRKAYRLITNIHSTKPTENVGGPGAGDPAPAVVAGGRGPAGGPGW